MNSTGVAFIEDQCVNYDAPNCQRMFEHGSRTQTDRRVEKSSILDILRLSYLIKILTTCVAICFLISSANAQPPSETDDGVYRIFVTLSSPNGTSNMSSGTGFLIAEQNFVLTNYHVIEKAKDIDIAFNSSGGRPKTVPAKVVWESADLDIAVLKTNQDLPGSPLVLMAQIPPNFPEKETDVSSIGYPGDADVFTQSGGLTSELLTSSRTKGIVSRVVKGRFYRHDQYVIQHDASISPGNSGGPLVDRCQRVVGINTWGSGDIEIATHASVLIAALRDNNISIKVTDSPCDPAIKVGGSNYAIYFFGLAMLAVVGFFLIWLRQKNRSPIPAHINQLPKQNKDVATPVAPQNIRNEMLVHIPSRTVRDVNTSKYIVFKSAGETLGRISEDSSIWSNDGVLIGRDSNQCDIVIDDDTVSRVHCRIFREKSGLTLEDCNSLTGTTVNNAPASDAVCLRNIDEGVAIEIGQSAIYLITED